MRVIISDVIAGLRGLPAASVHCCVTSPPYFGLRDYGTPGQIGLEATPDEFVGKLVEVFTEVHRVLRSDGTLWLNLGDSYFGSGKGPSNAKGTERGIHADITSGGGYPVRGLYSGVNGIKPKDLIGIPWRVAFALQAAGWYLRQDIIWHKPSPMPESVTDRCTKAHEYVFLLTKSERYYFDAGAIKEPLAHPPHAPGNRKLDCSRNDRDQMKKVWGADGKRNRRDVWTVASQPYKGAHFAVFPQKLIEPCILAGTSEAGCCPECGSPWRRVKRTLGWESTCTHANLDKVPCTVLDPFAGSGTTLLVAGTHHRDAIGIELNPEYIPLIEKRLHGISHLDIVRGPVVGPLPVDPAAPCLLRDITPSLA